MSSRESNLKEKFRIALTSTAKVISDDFDLNKKVSEKNKSKDESSMEIDTINSPSDFIKSLGLFILSISIGLLPFDLFFSETLLFKSKSSEITFAVEVNAILNFSFKVLSLLLI